MTLHAGLSWMNAMQPGTLDVLPIATVGCWTIAVITAWIFTRIRLFVGLLTLAVGSAMPFLSAEVALGVPITLGLLSVIPETSTSRLWRLVTLSMPVATAAGLSLTDTASLPLALLGAPMPTALAALAIGLLIVDVGRTRAASSRGMAVTLLTLAMVPYMNPEAAPLAPLAASVLGLITALESAWRLAFLDALTGLPGRRALNDKLSSLGRRYAIAIVDIDHFKNFNDRYGHDEGDVVLQRVAGVLAGVRGGSAYRMGGEEFALVFTGRSAARAMGEVDRLRNKVADISLRPTTAKGKHRRRPVRVTFSAGVCQRGARMAPSTVLTSADKALYRAKKAGRNRVIATK